jgi:hypothetical protein
MELNFTGRLTAVSLSKDEDLIAEFSIKTTESSSFNLIQALSEYKIDVNTINPIQPDWEMMDIPLRNWDINVAMTFDTVVIDVKMDSVKIKCKELKDGSSVKDYTFKFTKSATPNDINFALIYLNQRSENEDGKKEYTLYSVKLTDKKDEK